MEATLTIEQTSAAKIGEDVTDYLANQLAGEWTVDEEGGEFDKFTIAAKLIRVDGKIVVSVKFTRHAVNQKLDAEFVVEDPRQGKLNFNSRKDDDE